MYLSASTGLLWLRPAPSLDHRRPEGTCMELGEVPSCSCSLFIETIHDWGAFPGLTATHVLTFHSVSGIEVKSREYVLKFDLFCKFLVAKVVSLADRRLA